MASKLVSITTIPTRSDSDTVASYNVYTDKPSANTLVGTLTPQEALDGKALTFADGLNHNVTAKTVWTTAGESTTNVSNIVVVDLSVTEVDATLSLIALTKSGTAYTASSPTSSWNARGLAAEQIDADGYAVVDIVSVASIGNQLVKLRDTNVNEEYTVIEGIAAFVIAGVVYTLIAGGSGIDSGVTVAVGDRLRMIRTGTGVKCQKDVGSTGTWTDIVDFGAATAINSGILYPQFTAGWQAGSYDGIITNPKVQNG